MISSRAVHLAAAAAALALLVLAAFGLRRFPRRPTTKPVATLSTTQSATASQARAGDPRIRAQRLKLGDFGYDAFVVDFGTPGVEIRYADRRGQRLGDLSALRREVESEGLELVMGMNAGMFKPDRSPVGLLIQGGKELAPIDLNAGEGNFYWRPNGVFAIDASGRSAIEPSDRFAVQPAISAVFATQSGPLLFWDGGQHEALRPDSRHLNVRNAVGVTPSSTVFAISRGPVTFYELAQAMRELGCTQALYLDGTISRMYAPELGRLDRESDYGPMIAIVRRR